MYPLMLLLACIIGGAGVYHQNTACMIWASLCVALAIIDIIFSDSEPTEETYIPPKKTKSYIIKEYAHKNNIPVIDMKLIETEPSDMMGEIKLK